MSPKEQQLRLPNDYAHPQVTTLELRVSIFLRSDSYRWAGPLTYYQKWNHLSSQKTWLNGACSSNGFMGALEIGKEGPRTFKRDGEWVNRLSEGSFSVYFELDSLDLSYSLPPQFEVKWDNIGDMNVELLQKVLDIVPEQSP